MNDFAGSLGLHSGLRHPCRQDSAYSAVWAEARKTALTEARCHSPLGRGPYDLQNAAVSLWLILRP
jgi:hypothetical protein